MSKTARIQAKIWDRYHPIEISDAMEALSVEFESQFSPEDKEGMAWKALEIRNHVSSGGAEGLDRHNFSPSTICAGMCWSILHSEDLLEVENLAATDTAQ
jgi:hypothetical protein